MSGGRMPGSSALNSGWVAISRKIMDSPDLRTPMERWAMVWMVMHAAVKPATVRTSRASVEIGRGQFTHSTRHLAAEWGMSEASVRRLLTKLEKRRTIRRERDAEGDAGQVVVTLCNYDQYQLTDASLTQRRRSDDAAATQNITGKQENNLPSEESPLPPEGARGRKRPKDRFIEPDLSTTPEFDEFWEAYPRKVGKQAAKTLFLRYRPEHQRVLIGAAKRFARDMAAERRDPTKIPHPKTWLNPENGGFGDYVKGSSNGTGRRAYDGEQRGPDAQGLKDRTADPGDLFPGGARLRGDGGGNGPAECAGAGGSTGGESLEGVHRFDGRAERGALASLASAGRSERAGCDGFDADALASGHDGYRGRQSAWVH